MATAKAKTETIEIKNRWNGSVIFSCEIDVTPDMLPSVKLGLAVRVAVERGADLSGANLSGAYLRSANLSSADLRSADLRSADLSSADLRSADLRSADLRSADLRSADLSSADLSSADLSSADLRSANLSYANLRYAKNSDLAIAQTRILPEGSLIGWKKCQSGVIVKLRIPEESPRSHAFGRKCRAQFVEVLEVIGADHGISKHDGVTTYRTGERVECDRWDEDWQDECSGGLHFFITRQEAEAY